MKNRLKTALSAGVASALLLTLLTTVWAASQKSVAAPLFIRAQRTGGSPGIVQRHNARAGAAPSVARFRESESKGLLVETWVNGVGPFNFALDTGAGATILSRRTAAEARVEVEAGGRGVELGGLSGRTIGGGARAFPRSLALGFRENLLPARGFVVVAPNLPEGIDGVLDPAESYHPFGFVIDMPRGEIRAFDPRQTPLRAGDHPPGGAILRWLTDGRTRRPFVALAAGRPALLDTGSAYGLAVDEAAARALGIEGGGGGDRSTRRDIAGGSILARRIRPSTVNLGPLTLRRVPTDLLLQAEKGAPVILGRDALRPFELVFDPASRLIMLKPAEE